MSPSKTNPTATVYLKKSEIRQQQLKAVRDAAEKAKKNAIKAANEPMGACLFVAVFMLALLIAPPALLVLL